MRGPGGPLFFVSVFVVETFLESCDLVVQIVESDDCAKHVVFVLFFVSGFLKVYGSREVLVEHFECY